MTSSHPAQRMSKSSIARVDMERKIMAAHPVYRLVLVGDSGVGKSSLLRRYVDSTARTEGASTVGVDFATVRGVRLLGDRQVNLEIWDTAGQERFRSVVAAYYRRANGMLFVFDVTNRESFAHVLDWINDVRDTLTPRVFAGIPKMLVGTKTDLRRRRVIHAEEGREFARAQDAMEYVEASANEGRVDHVFVPLAERIVPSSCAPVPPVVSLAQEDNKSCLCGF